VDFSLQYNLGKNDFQIPVLIEIEPERIEQVHGEIFKGPLIETLVARGLRAQLKTGSLITGQKFVDLAFHPKAPAAKVGYERGVPVLPTLPQPLKQLMASVENIIGRLDQVPTDEIGRDVKEILESLNSNLRKTDTMFGEINEEVLPEIARTLKTLQASLADIEKGYGEDSVTNQELRKTLGELEEAARSIRILTEYLQRHPEALIHGKGDGE